MAETHVTAPAAPTRSTFLLSDFLREYGILIIIALLMIGLTLLSPSFLSPRNLLNILNQSAPLALIGNGFNILNVNPFFKDLTTGVIIVVAVALSAGKKRR